MSDSGEPRSNPILIAFLLLAAIAAVAFGYEAGWDEHSMFYRWMHKCQDRHCATHDVAQAGSFDNPDNGVAAAGTPLPTRTASQMAVLRHAAWQNDDFWAQIELGQIYNDEGKADYDPVEAYVWYFLASINPQAVVDVNVSADDTRGQYDSVYDSLSGARHHRAQIAELFSSDQRDMARDRIIYVLACRGPAGFALLGELYSPWSPLSGADGDGADTSHDHDPHGDADRGGDSGYDFDNAQMPIAKDLHDSMLYFDLAERSGSSISAHYREYADKFRQYLIQDQHEAIVIQASDDAARWHLPFPFYPGTSMHNGTPLTDECNGGVGDRYPEEVDDRPISDWVVQQSLWALNFIRVPPQQRLLDPSGPDIHNAIIAYQRANGKEPTGWLTIHNQLELLTQAAERGDPASQIALGKIYVTGSIQSVPEVANGDGELWWKQVVNDRRSNNYFRGMAAYDLASIYSKGYGDVAEDDREASRFDLERRQLGFDPNRGPRDLVCTPDEVAQDREPGGGDAP
jgi:hypothetical protein